MSMTELERKAVRATPPYTYVIRIDGVTQQFDAVSATQTLEPIAPAPTPAGRDRAREQRPVLRRCLVTTVLAIIAAVQGWNITNYPAVSDDEGTYLAQAWAVRHGLGLAHYTYWYDHPPLGWIQIAIGSWIPALLFPDGPAVAYGRLIMPVVTLVSASLLYLLARRLGTPAWAAILATVLFGLSPLGVTMNRQVYLDSIAVAWMLAAFVLALSPRRAMWPHIAAGLAAAISVLSKETMLLAVPGLVVALWQGTHLSTRKFSVVGFACGFVLTGALYPLYAALKGELLPGEDHVSLVAALLFQVRDRTGSGSILSPGSGAHELLRSWLFYDPVLPLAGVVAVLLGLFVRTVRAPAVAGAAFVLMALRPDGYLPAMYAIQVLPFFAITIAGLLWVAGKRLVRPYAARRLGIALLVALAMPALALVTPRWVVGDHRALTASENRPYAQAVAWIRANVDDPGLTTILVDDAIWLDLVNAGFEPGYGAIWFYKLDLDPGVADRVSWRDLDYLVSSPIIRRDAQTLPGVASALANSDAMATFGEGDDRIEIRRIRREDS